MKQRGAGSACGKRRKKGMEGKGRQQSMSGVLWIVTAAVLYFYRLK